MAGQFDYVIVGAGSAGCVLANRLSADPSVTVALVEAGGPDRSPNIKMPAAFPKLFHSKYDWDLLTTSQPELKAREMYWPRGRTLGGSSSLNAQMWLRGTAADYDGWGAGAAGWSYAQALPYFHRAENRVGSNAGDTYGVGGPLYIEELRDPNPLRAPFLEACAELGYIALDELNVPAIGGPAGSVGGYGPTPVTQHRGRRWSAADGYLRPARKRANLTVLDRATVHRVVCEGGRATGVEYHRRGAAPTTLQARREVILSAGAVHSPALLERSGIGDPDVLAAAGIALQVARPAVGTHLQDHLSTGVVMFTRDPITLVAAERPQELARFLFGRRGMLTSNVAEAVAFGRSDPALAEPDLEYLFAPVPFIQQGQVDPPGHGLTVGVVLLQPDSAGTVHVTSADPDAAPVIEAAYLREPRDLQRLLTGVAQCRALLATRALGPHVTEPMLPESADADVVEHIRQTSETLYHPVGTCRMGDDEDSVVDAQLRVRGVDRLRVVDASVMPQIIRGHTHAPTVMIAERAADLIATG